jgi:hypothetical protein
VYVYICIIFDERRHTALGCEELYDLEPRILNYLALQSILRLDLGLVLWLFASDSHYVIQEIRRATDKTYWCQRETVLETLNVVWIAGFSTGLPSLYHVYKLGF